MAQDIKGILFDMDGVLYEGERPVAGAAEAITWCRQAGLPFLFLTNTTSRPRSSLLGKLAGVGIDVTEEQILTPPLAARRWLEAHHVGPIALFVPAATRAEFDGLDSIDWRTATQAAAVIVGDLGEGWDFHTLNTAFRLLMSDRQPPLLALGLTRYWQAEDGLRLDTGPFVKALEYASDRQAVVLGKPARPFFETALHLLGLPPAQVIMIGDDIRSDIEAAQQTGMRGVLVRTGKFRPADLEAGIMPYAVLDSVASLPQWLTAQPS